MGLYVENVTYSQRNSGLIAFDKMTKFQGTQILISQKLTCIWKSERQIFNIFIFLFKGMGTTLGENIFLVNQCYVYLGENVSTFLCGYEHDLCKYLLLY